MSEELDLFDWRRQVADLYRQPGVEAFRAARDALFRRHPQSPIPAVDRPGFKALRYFEPDPRYRVRCVLGPAEPGEVEIDTGGEDGIVRYRRAGRLRAQLPGGDVELTLFRQLGYGGGLFLPFRDGTSGKESYGGGRYLVDTVKMTLHHALEVTPGSDEVVLDFNFAYNPSCAYDPHWACPLAPYENRVERPIRAGELVYP